MQMNTTPRSSLFQVGVFALLTGMIAASTPARSADTAPGAPGPLIAMQPLPVGNVAGPSIDGDQSPTASLAFAQRKQRLRTAFIERMETRLAETQVDIEKTFAGKLPAPLELAALISRRSAAVRAMEPRAIETPASRTREARINELLQRLDTMKAQSATRLARVESGGQAMQQFDEAIRAEFQSTSQELTALYAQRSTEAEARIDDPEKYAQAKAELSRYIRFGEFEDGKRLLAAAKQMQASDAAAVAAAEAALARR
jgi:hypothetical protein